MEVGYALIRGKRFAFLIADFFSTFSTFAQIIRITHEIETKPRRQFLTRGRHV